MSHWQRQIYKRDDRYVALSKNLIKDNNTEGGGGFEEHFKEYDEIVDTSIRIYTSDGFKGTVFSTGVVGAG